MNSAAAFYRNCLRNEKVEYGYEDGITIFKLRMRTNFFCKQIVEVGWHRVTVIK